MSQPTSSPSTGAPGSEQPAPLASARPETAEALLASRPPHSGAPDALRAIDGTLRRLRAEQEAAPEKGQKARLLGEIAELEERAGDEPGAARDYLAAYNTEPTFREPLEALVRLLERRRSLKNLARVIDALVRSAETAEEKARALTMRAAYLEDVAADRAGAKVAAEEAAAVGAGGGEGASAWLTLELVAARLGDADARARALAGRAQASNDPTWRGLLLIDLARLAASNGDLGGAMHALDEARNEGGEATFSAAAEMERIAHRAARGARDPGEDAGARLERAVLRARALESQAALVEATVAGTDDGRAGVPSWARTPAHAVDAWLRAAALHREAGDLEAAGNALDRGLAGLEGAAADAPRAEMERVLLEARMRVADACGDATLAASIAERLMTGERDGTSRAALAVRAADAAAGAGHRERARELLADALSSDPGSLVARQLELEIADETEGHALAKALEAIADELVTDDARGRALCAASWVWAESARDGAAAKAALTQAGLAGIPQRTVARLGRALASLLGDDAWYDETTRRLLAACAGTPEAVSLGFELARTRLARGDVEGAAGTLHDLGNGPEGAWLARVLEAYLPGLDPARGRAALDELAAAESDEELARALAVAATLRAALAGDAQEARAKLRELHARDERDVLVAVLLGELERAGGAPLAASRVAAACAVATAGLDPELGAALHLETAFERFRHGDRRGALESFAAAADAAPAAARVALAYASRAVDADVPAARLRAIQRATPADNPDQAAAIALERFATELAGEGEGRGPATDAALAALGTAEVEASGDLAIATALLRLVAPAGTVRNDDATRAAVLRIGAAGAEATALAAAEQVRLAREDGDAAEAAAGARSWLEAGGGLAAALEWLTAVTQVGDVTGEIEARRAMAQLFEGDAREAMYASSALLRAVHRPEDGPFPLLAATTSAARHANLELAPPGSDPRRRALGLATLTRADFDDAAPRTSHADGLLPDAQALAGWSYLALGDPTSALPLFERAARANPDDLGAWEGLRTAAELVGDPERHAGAASELGARTADAARGAAYWEEAGEVLTTLGDVRLAEVAYEGAFARDPRRALAFDRLFRAVRERKEGDRLLGLVRQRLLVTDDPPELAKLFWEQSRVLREKGDQDGALKALENVTMIEPDHVGALALSGEIFIRKQRFEEAAEQLARLAALPAAPAKNRLTAGVAAVDLFENKLQRFDRALEVLSMLHAAKLSTLPVRERLARAAARTGSWSDATAILEELMHERPEPEGRVEAARLAMAIHRDRLGKPEAGRRALHKLLDEAPTDGEGIDAVLTIEPDADVRARYLSRARSALREGLAEKPLDAAAVRRLARVARALGEDDLQHAALTVAVALGGGDAATEQGIAQLAARKPRAPQIALAPQHLAAFLAPGDEGPLAELFLILGPTLSEALGPSLSACGVSKRDRVDPRSGLAMRNEVAAWTGAFGVRDFELYVGGKDPLGVQGVPGEMPALVVGAGVNAPLAPVTRARVARELFAMGRGTTVLRHRDEPTIACIVIACCNLADVPVSAPPYAMLADVEKLLSKTMARRVRKAIVEPCRAIARGGLDPRVWARSALLSHARAAAVASGDAAIAAADLLGEPVERLGPLARGDARVEALLCFVLSPEYLELRGSLGLEGGS